MNIRLRLALFSALTACIQGIRPRLDPPGDEQLDDGFQFVVFGDSYSDQGRLSAMVNKTKPGANYWEGRYSNGPTWPEYLQAARQGQTEVGGNASFPVHVGQHNMTLLNLTLPRLAQPHDQGVSTFEVINFALGGSPACEENKDFVEPGGRTLAVPWLAQQLDDYVRLNTTNASALAPPARRVVFIEMGANDYLNQIENITAARDLDLGLPDLPEQVVSCIAAAARRLLDMGELHLVIATLPVVDRLPQVQALGIDKLATSLGSFTDRHNTALRQAVSQLQANYSHDVIRIYELGLATEQLLSRPEAFNITNTGESCLQYASKTGDVLSKIPLVGEKIAQFANDLLGTEVTGRCENPSQYLWWDRVHPTTTVHSLLAEDIDAHLQAWGW